MNKKIVLYIIPAVLAGCIAQQSSVRKDASTSSMTSPSPASAQQLAPATKTQPVVAQVASVDSKKSGSVSAQTQTAIESLILCQTPVRVEPLQARLTKESVITGAAIPNGSGSDYKAASHLAVFGLPVTFVTFAGNDDSDWAEAGVMVTANSQAVMKALSAKNLRLKKAPETGGLMAKGKNGVFRISQTKKGTYISCSRGWD